MSNDIDSKISQLDSKILQKTYGFKVEDAVKHGVDGAIILYFIRGWLEFNLLNKTNIHDNYVWTFNATSAFCKYLPFWSKDQIYRTIQKLKKNGAILIGNYNQTTYDRTNWYSMPEFQIDINHESRADQENQPSNDQKIDETSHNPQELTFREIAKCKLQNCKMEIAEARNQFREIASPIPSNLTSNLQNNNNAVVDDDLISRYKCVQQLDKQHQNDVAQVLEHWKKVMSSQLEIESASNSNVERAQCVLKKLNEGYVVSVLKRVIDAAYRDDFVMARTSQSKNLYNSLYYIFRDSPKPNGVGFERFIAKAQQASKAGAAYTGPIINQQGNDELKIIDKYADLRESLPALTPEEAKANFEKLANRCKVTRKI